MKFKRLLTSLIASGSLLTVASVNPVKASCKDAPPTGDKMYPIGPGQYKIRTTVRRTISSNNDRKIEFAFKKLELEAMRRLALFVKTNVVAFDNLTEEQKDDAMVYGEGDTAENFKEASEIISGIKLSADELLRGSVEVGRCHEPGVAVMLTRGINSETAALLSDPKPNSIEKSDTNSNSQIKTYRSDVDQGYSGYGNLDDF